MKFKIIIATICLCATSFFCAPILTIAQDKETNCKYKPENKCEENRLCLDECSDIERLKKIKEILEKTIAKTENIEKNKKTIEAHKDCLEKIKVQIEKLSETTDKK